MIPAIRHQWHRLREWRRVATLVRGDSGKGFARQAREIARLRLGTGKLSGREYYDYGLYDDRRFSWKAKQEFVGARHMAAVYKRLNQGNWFGISDDKLLFYSLLTSLGLPYPHLYAVYHPGGRPFGGVPSFRDIPALATFLRDRIPYPFFAKPARGGYGVDAVGVVAFDKGELTLTNGERVTLEQLLDPHRVSSLFGNLRQFGYLFQEHLKPHPQLVEVCGARVSSIRLVVVLSAEGPRALHAVWKITTGRNMTDNFRHGASGNLLGYVSLRSGAVERVVRGPGAREVEVHVHPDTGAPLVGVKLPDWPRLLSLAMDGARALPGIRWQNWDIAMCPDGPVILELNANADIDLVQQARGAGLNDKALRAYLARLP